MVFRGNKGGGGSVVAKLKSINVSNINFALNRIFFLANEEATLKTKQPIRFQGLFKVTDQIAEK